MRSYLLPAVAAIFLAVGPMACSSSGEESPSPALEGAASGEEAASGNAATNGSNASGSENNAAVNANTEASNTAKPEGESAAANNPIGNELNNAIANEKGEGASNNAASPADGGAINAEANGNIAATGAADASAAPAGAADANASNPFASPSDAGAVPANAAPSEPAGGTYAAGAEPAAAPDAGATAPMGTESAAAAPAPAAGGESAGAASAPVATGPTALPEMGSKMAYYVMRGDTLGSIAQKIFGSRKKWKALQAENGLADANKIYPGDVIYFTLDESSKAFAEKYEIGNRQAYTIAKGDTLSGLAAKFYGTQGAWRSLWKENPQILNPDRIRVGMVLTYRATSKVALKDERENEGELKEDENETADNDSGVEGGLAVDESTPVQLTAAAE